LGANAFALVTNEAARKIESFMMDDGQIIAVVCFLFVTSDKKEESFFSLQIFADRGNAWWSVK
jgi:hypothetical protein